MRNNKGITLISLVSTVLLVIILAAITALTSMDSYNQMKFETFKARMEELQRKTDEVSADYQKYIKDKTVAEASKNYKAYFASKYGESPIALADVTDTTKYSSLFTKESIDKDLHSGEVFTFESADVVKYLGLKGIESTVVIDFATRKVYSVEGQKDPDDNEKIYYTSSEWNGNQVITRADTAESSLTEANLAGTKANKTVGSTTMYEITLTISGRDLSKTT